MSAPKRGFVAAAVMAVVAAFVLIAAVGTTLPRSAVFPLQFDGPTCVDSDGSATVLADSESRRVLILNEENQLSAVVNYSVAFNAPIQAVTSVCVSGDYVFVAGVSYYEDSSMIERERVLVYDKQGAYLGQAYQSEQRNDSMPQVKRLTDCDDGVVITLWQSEESNQSGTKLRFLHVSHNGEVTQLGDEGAIEVQVLDAAYVLQDNAFAYLSIRGVVDDTFGKNEELQSTPWSFTSIDMIPGGTIYATDDITGDICEIKPDGSQQVCVEGGKYTGVHTSNGVLSACNRDANAIMLASTDGAHVQNLSQAPLSPRLMAIVITVMLCSVYLIVFLLILVIRRVRRIIAQGSTLGLGPVFASVSVLLVVGLVMGHFSFNAYDSSKTTRQHEIAAFAEYVQDVSSTVGKPLQAISNRSLIRGDAKQVEESIMAIFEGSLHLSALVDAADNNAIGMYYTIYMKDDQGIYTLMDSDSEQAMCSDTVPAFLKDKLDQAFEGKSPTPLEMQTGRTLRDSTMFQLIPITLPADGSIIAVVELGSRMRSFEASITDNLMQRIISLIIMALAVFLAYVELRTCARRIMQARVQRTENQRDSLALLTRPFTLCVIMLSSIDAVMTVLISRMLLTNANMDSSGMLLAIPTAMLGVGVMIGHLIFGRVSHRISARKQACAGAVAMFVCSLLTAASVALGNFWLYAGAKLVMAIPFGSLYALGYSLPRATSSKQLHTTTALDVRNTDTSAAALGTVLGGYIAQSLGNAWVYLLIAVASIPVLLIAYSLFPHSLQVFNEKHVPKAKQESNALRLLKNRSIVALATFVVLPITIAAGYTSFVFPLFSAGAGLAAVATSNLFVIGQLVVFVCIKLISKAEAQFGRWRVICVALALLAAVFLLFSFNQKLVWAVVVIALVGVLCKFTDGWKSLWIEEARDCGVQPGYATGLMLSTRSVALIVQPLVLGALLALSDSVAVIILGAFCAACVLIFFLATRSSLLAKR